jgi:arabinofuranan 3-O-arabinosyltransferase
VLTTLGSISSETLPMMLAPWVLLPVILALKGDSGRPLRMLAARAGIALALMGAVNAVATITGCLPAIIWWLCHRPNRTWWRFAAWWALASALAVVWWVVALLLLGQISPPFLDFIESSGVTTQWTSLIEVLRGTDSWTPFVSPNATAGSSLVTQPVMVLATVLVAAGGLAGLALRSMPARGRLVTMLLVGVVLLAVGYSGGLGSPLAHQVQLFLDAAGAPLRNVHKLEPVIRIPLVLGIAHLLSRIPLPGSAPRPVWIRAFAHPEDDKRVAVGIVVLAALAVATSMAWTGRLTPPGTFRAIPDYWHQAAAWLAEHNTGHPTPGRVLVAPGAPFATQVWGNSHDEPMQVLSEVPWGVRDSIPLTPPQTIRALDSVQRLFAAGRPSAGLADTLLRQGISYVVVRNDLDPDTSRSARPLLVHRAIDGSPGLTKVAQFGEPVGAGTLSGFISDSGLRPRYPAVEIYRVDTQGNPGAPYLTDASRMARVDGGPEVLLRLDERRRLLGRAALGPVLLTSDAQRANLPVPVVTVTDTPVDRETDYGRVDDHSSAVRAEGDRRTTFNRVPDYPVPGAKLVHGAWSGGRLSASSSSSDATTLPNVSPSSGPAAAIDGDSATAWVSNSLQPAVGQWLQVDFDHPVTNATLTVTPSATAVGAQVRRLQVSTVNGTTTVRFDEPGKPLTIALPVGETPWVRITAIGTDDGSAGVQFGITDLSVTQYDASGYAHPVDIRHTVVVPGPPTGSAVAAWDLGSELLGRPGCADSPDGVHCAASMSQAPEEPVTLSRTLTVPAPIQVNPIVWVRARQGPNLADLIAQPGTIRSRADSDLIDVDGSAYAATDGDPRTAWTAPQGVVQHRTAPTLTVTLPKATEVTGLQLTPSSSPLPTHPTMVAIDLGDGPQVRRLKAGDDTAAQTVTLRPRITDTVRISLLNWDDVIDRTALGFDQLKPPGLAEVAVLGPDGKPVAEADVSLERVGKGFPLGNAMTKEILDMPEYEKWFAARFRYATLENEMKWYSTEFHQNEEDYKVSDKMVELAEKHNITLRGHNVFWDDQDKQMDWVEKLGVPELKEAMAKRLKDIVTRYAGKVIHWDVVNENLHFNFFEGKLGKDASAEIFRDVAKLDSKPILFMNEFNTIEEPNDAAPLPTKYVAKLKQIREFPGNADLKYGIGLESHFAAPNIPYMRGSIDTLAQAKVPIWLTEVDVKPCKNQVEYLDEVMREGFAHPAVKGIVLWGAWHAKGCYVMCFTDNSFKNLPVGDAIDKLLKEWTAGHTGKTDSKGVLEVEIFHGEYNATVKHKEFKENCMTLDLDSKAEAKIELRSSTY